MKISLFLSLRRKIHVFVATVQRRIACTSAAIAAVFAIWFLCVWRLGPLHLIEAYPIRISRAMCDEILSFLPLTSLYQMRSINRATCRTIEYMDEFVNKYSEALLLLNKAPSPMIEIEEDLDLEAEAVLQKEQAAEEERRARARSRSRKRQEKKP